MLGLGTSLATASVISTNLNTEAVTVYDSIEECKKLTNKRKSCKKERLVVRNTIELTKNRGIKIII